MSGYPKIHPPWVGLAGLDTQRNRRSGKGQAKASHQRKCLWSRSILDLQPRDPGNLDGLRRMEWKGELDTEVGMWDVGMTDKPI